MFDQRVWIGVTQWVVVGRGPPKRQFEHGGELLTRDELDGLCELLFGCVHEVVDEVALRVKRSARLPSGKAAPGEPGAVLRGQ
jgi:hypothetical protein